MWVRSQNKKELVDCLMFSVTRNIGGKKKSAISGSFLDGVFGRKEIILGLYDTNEQAIHELTRLQSELFTSNKVFEME